MKAYLCLFTYRLDYLLKITYKRLLNFKDANKC